jgi:Beta-lactamase enzyme family
MYVRTRDALGPVPTSYLYDSSINGVGEYVLGQVTPDHACLSRLKCVPHQHVPHTCADGKLFTSAASPTTMTRSAMNPGFFHEFDTGLHAKLQNLLLDTPKYAVMLADESKKKHDPSAGDRVRVALVDLTGDKICKPGYADWGSTFPTTGGSTVKIAMLYAAHQLLFDLNEMARTGGLKTVAELKKKADEAWSQLICPPDLDWLVEFDSTGPTVRAKASKNLDLHLKQMVIAAFSNSSVTRANQLIMRLGFEYIASVLWQSGLRRSRGRGLWVRNTYQQAKILAPVNPKCNYKTRYMTPEGERERIVWSQDPTDDTEFSLTALSVVTFFTLLAQRRLVNEAASVAMEALLKQGCIFPLDPFPIPGVKVRATKCGLTSDVMHVATLLESASGNRRYALAVLVLRKNEPMGKTKTFLNSFVKDVDKLIKANNP